MYKYIDCDNTIKAEFETLREALENAREFGDFELFNVETGEIIREAETVYRFFEYR